MKSLADIRHSIRSVGDMRQITSAMRLISTSKMQKAIARYEANALHFNRVQSAIKDILVHSHDLNHYFLEKNKGGNPAYIVIAGDKGLCGGYNFNVLNFAYDLMKDQKEKFVLTVGQEARVFFERKKVPIDIEFLHIAQAPSLYSARRLTEDLAELYRENSINELFIVFTRFYSSVKQKPEVIKLLPMEMENFTDVNVELEYQAEISYHPSAKAVFDILVPQYLIGLVYGALVQSFASEHCARMMAMENATNNADDMLSRLQLEFNGARQQMITNEISEIVGAVEVLK